MRKCWTDEEVCYLIKLYEKDGLSASEIVDKFTNRTVEAIQVKISRLKLRHSSEQIGKIKSRLNSGELNGMYAKVSPMNGLTKQNSELIRIKSIKMSETRKKCLWMAL